jgi:hypothetical protein
MTSRQKKDRQHEAAMDRRPGRAAGDQGEMAWPLPGMFRPGLHRQPGGRGRAARVAARCLRGEALDAGSTERYQVTERKRIMSDQPSDSPQAKGHASRLYAATQRAKAAENEVRELREELAGASARERTAWQQAWERAWKAGYEAGRKSAEPVYDFGSGAGHGDR